MAETALPDVAVPVRETDQLIQCRCLLTSTTDVNVNDRCTDLVTDPDSPLCDHCEQQHRTRLYLPDNVIFHMVPL